MTTSSGAASLQDRTGQILVALLLGLVALSVVGMHQLSLGHAFATPSTSPSQHQAGGHHGGAGHHLGTGHHLETGTGSADTHLVDAVVHTTARSTVTHVDSTGTPATDLHVPTPDRASVMSGGAAAALTATSPIGGPGGAPGEPGCPGCGEHSMALGACLLALTLLVGSWPLLLPRARLLPPTLRLRLAPTVDLVARRIPALSLAELSILRT